MSEEKKAKRSSSEKSASAKEIDVINGIRRWVDRLPEHRKVAVLQFVAQGIESDRYDQARQREEQLKLEAYQRANAGGAAVQASSSVAAAFD